MQKLWLKSYERGVPASINYANITLQQLLFETVRRFPKRPALIYYGNTITYEQLDLLSNRLANALIEMGVQKGDRVAIMLPNVPQCLIGYFGALKAGAIVVQTNPLYVERELEQQLNDSGAETIVALDIFYEKISRIRHRVPLKRIILTGVGDYLPPLLRLFYPIKAMKEGQWVRVSHQPPVYDFRKLLKRSEGVQPIVPVKPDDTALLQYTGGTTGVPKGVMLSHNNLMANAVQCRHWMPSLRDGEEVFLGVVPFFHVYGLSTCMNLGLLTGSCIVLLPRFKTDDVLKTIVRHRVTIFMGVQAMYVAINNYSRIGQFDLSSIRICISGAGPLHREVQDRFEELTGGKLVEGYGLSEASPVTHCTPIHGLRKKGSIGLPFPDTDARIMDRETGRQELPIGEIGELAVRGPQVMQGYWNKDDETKQVLRDGWLYTGDMARMDEDGYFYIVDRKKDMIKTRGENVYPREVEEVLFRHPKIKEAVVIGIPDTFSVELIKAYVVLKEHEHATEEEIRDYCRKELAKFKVPKWVEFRKELPKTMVGKVLRRILLEEELGRKRSEVVR
ncbi:MAG TPA: long-chain fatty acid--CoA ligase [Nitrospiria bacterium]|nr:long-chain fatty acid--CoA ligase [Nitrospiria bacterium]HUK55595.1 long-chain fatty acid--CoA ligase [Nitrospiria bacterium]